MGERKYWKNEYEYRDILDILSDYWLTELHERFVRVEMYFEKDDGQTQKKCITWHNPNMGRSLLGDGRHVSEERLKIELDRLPKLISARQLAEMGDMPFKEFTMIKHGHDETPLGDFARDLARDKRFPIYDYSRMYGENEYHDMLRRYLEDHGSCPEAIKAFDQCYGEWLDRYDDTEVYEKAKKGETNANHT